ncbi:SapC family protein [Agaribacter flavus]|uniref:SapC family protein n=1 Tax=Agaribacter flavus TaxID=1902781 RepID=A0ABV7FQ41_9ALTE
MAINYIPLDKAKHSALKVAPRTEFSFAAKTHLAAATIREYAQLAGTMPVVFIKDPNTNNVHSVAMLGLEQGKNLFWHDDQWQAAHVPLNIQRYPFDIRPDGDKLGVFIDENSSLFGDEGDALFTEDGEPSEALKARQQFLADLANSEVLNQRFVKEIQALDLLDEIQVRIRYTNGQNRNVTGIFTINEKKLLELSDEKVLEMHKAGFLGACYSVMLSLGQLNRLVELSNKTDNPIQSLQIVPAEKSEEAKTEDTANA